MPHRTQDTVCPVHDFAYGSLTLYAVPSQILPLSITDPYVSPTTPTQRIGLVWAIPRSLAATQGVSFDFLSYGYLDVSVPRVGSFRYWPMTASGFPHSEISGSSLACQLAETYRRLLRLSSPLNA